jgi:flagellar basal body-associated protein FliL
MSKDQYQNQTDFAKTEPIFENASLPTAPKMINPELDHELALDLAAKKKQKIVIVLLVSAAIFALILVMIITYFFTSAPKDQTNNTLQIEPETTQVQESQLEREIKLLKQRLDEIDPIREFLITPPVDYDLKLE